jgi:hypothetical protein
MGRCGAYAAVGVSESKTGAVAPVNSSRIELGLLGLATTYNHTH